MYTAQSRLTLSGCRLVLLDDPGGGAALYYASPHPSGSQSSLSKVSVVSSRAWRAAILVVAKMYWDCQPGYWAPPAGVRYGVGVVQDCRDEEEEQARRIQTLTSLLRSTPPQGASCPASPNAFTKLAQMLGVVQACSAGFYGSEAGYIRPTCNGSCWLGHCMPTRVEPAICPSCPRVERLFVRLPS